VLNHGFTGQRHERLAREPLCSVSSGNNNPRFGIYGHEYLRGNPNTGCDRTLWEADL